MESENEYKSRYKTGKRKNRYDTQTYHRTKEKTNRSYYTHDYLIDDNLILIIRGSNFWMVQVEIHV